MSSLSLTVPPPCVDSGDTSWVNVSTALVLMMSPALALFEGGLLRSKNNLSVIIQIFTGIILISLLWWICGYSFAFGADHNGILGDLDNAFFIDVDYQSCSYHAPTIPITSYAMFQMVFAIITPLLVTGAFAERMAFKVYVCWLVLWHLFIYLPVAHWVFADGWLSNWGVLDFAGGIVIHTTAGISAFTSAIIIGKRVDFDEHHGDPPASSFPMAALGMCLIWVGWYGFNGGSAGASGSLSTTAVVATQLGASASGFVWFVLSWKLDGKVTAGTVLNGPLAGLAGITPASGYMNAPASILCGVLLGTSSFFSARFVKRRLKIDDALDVSSVHGVAGMVGSVFLGLFAQQRLNPGGFDGAVYGYGALFGKQIVAVLFVSVYTAILNSLILYFCIFVFGSLRVSSSQERMGLDVSDHNGIAYVQLEAVRETPKAVGTESDVENGTTKESNESAQNSNLVKVHPETTNGS